jgi:hypothetical protein
MESFIDTLVQSMQHTTTNVKEIIQVGRMLWPQYIEPLSSPESIRGTLRTAHENLTGDRLSSQSQSSPKPALAALQREVLSILDRKLRPALVAVTGCGRRDEPDPHGQ